jgi:hypothetical protein
MSCTIETRFTINEFKNFMFDEYIPKLSDETMNIIQKIADQVGDPEYVKTPQFISAMNENKRKNRQQQTNVNRQDNSMSQLLDENWKAIRNFHVTPIVKKEGIRASIDSIRKNLNKMTDKTYDTIKLNIVEELNKIIGEENKEKICDELLDEMNKVGNTIFAIASGNSFYSEIYAKLYKELMHEYPIMDIIFKKNFEEFSSVFKTVEYVDPEVDYDKFCDINKVNEKRRALSLFYINLMKNNVIDPLKVITIVSELNEYMFRLMEEKNNRNVVEELSEVVFIMITKGHTQFKSHPKWNEIIQQIASITKLKATSKPSISNKTIFKYMDIMDTL